MQHSIGGSTFIIPVSNIYQPQLQHAPATVLPQYHFPSWPYPLLTAAGDGAVLTFETPYFAFIRAQLESIARYKMWDQLPTV